MGCGSSSQPTVSSSEEKVLQQTAPLPPNNKTDGEMIRYIEDGVIPEPKPSKLKKKDLIVDVQEFSKVDDHVRKTDEEMIRYIEDGVIPEPKPSKLKKKDLIVDVQEFSKVDDHARKAPKNLRESLPDLVNYLGNASKDPLFLVRSFFVWCAKNIRYDTDGFFGETEMASCDYKSVMMTGVSVCEGYANVMKEMCKQAKIPVKKLSGYSKGYGFSPERPFSTDLETNHAWNAVFVRGNWFLLDSTWGAGKVADDQKFEAKFDEFYFLTDVECFALSHFPYSHDAPNESLKWQLLERPLSLETFNRVLDIQPAAYSVGLLPVSHMDAIIKVNDEIELTFKEEIPKSIKLLTQLYKEEANILKGQVYCCYAYWSKGFVRVKAIPPVSGIYRLQIFGGDRSTGAEGIMPQLFEYQLHCNTVSKGNASRKFPLPDYYTQAFIDECQVLEPLGKQIPPETEIMMRFQSPVLKCMMINDNLLEKKGDIFEGKAMSPKSGYLIQVYGSRSDNGSLNGLYDFAVA